MTQLIELTAVVSKNQLGQRLDQAAAKLFPKYSRSRIKEWILDKRVLVDGNVCGNPKKRVLGKEVISINTDIKNDMFFMPQNIPLNILYEDDDIIIINKPCNLVVHPGAGNLDGTVLNALLHYYPPIANVPRAGIVHRLDKDTTGLMIIAKTVLAQMNLIKSLQLRKITREYEAIVVGHIAVNGTIDQPISRHRTKRTHMSVSIKGKPAITHYYVMEHFRENTRLRLRLETGRTHQIRVHMAYINHPLVGDKFYGYRLEYSKRESEFISVLSKFNRQALHAGMLRFDHPINGINMECLAPIPQDMMKLIKFLRIDVKKHEDHETSCIQHE